MKRAAVHAVHLAAARNLAAWHTSSTRGLGLKPVIGDRWWTCAMSAPNVYYSAVSVAPAPTRRERGAMLEALGPHTRDRETAVVSVCDSWNQLDLATLGLHRRTVGRWVMRPAAPGLTTPRHEVAGLRIEQVVDRETLAVFEATMVEGFGARRPIAPFDIHGPAILDDPAMTVLVGWSGDEAVACAMTYVTDVAGVYGVATRPAWRRRGFATALATAAAAVAPHLVTVLQPTPEAAAMYGSLGFVDLGSFSHWA